MTVPAKKSEAVKNTFKILRILVPIRGGKRKKGFIKASAIELRDTYNRWQSPRSTANLLFFKKKAKGSAKVYRREFSQRLYSGV
jgi:hypothetical protein